MITAPPTRYPIHRGRRKSGTATPSLDAAALIIGAQAFANIAVHLVPLVPYRVPRPHQLLLASSELVVLVLQVSRC